MKRFKIFDIFGFPPKKVLQEGVIEAETARQALEKAWEFDGEITHVTERFDGLTDIIVNKSYMYDVSCYQCDGKRVSPEIIRDRADQDDLRQLDDWFQCMAEDRATRMAEMRMGA